MATGFFKQRTVEHGIWAFGALSFGLGILPFVAGLAGSPPPPSGRSGTSAPSALPAALRCLLRDLRGSQGGVPLDGLRPARARAQRDLPRADPLRRHRLRARAARSTRLVLVAAAALAGYLVLATPYKLDKYPYFEAPGLSILAFANREFDLGPAEDRTRLLVVLALSVALLAARIVVRAPSARRALESPWPPQSSSGP